MKCPECNAENHTESNFCTSCGAKLKKKCKCWVKKKDSYDCGESNCPGYGLYRIEKLKSK